MGSVLRKEGVQEGYKMPLRYLAIAEGLERCELSRPVSLWSMGREEVSDLPVSPEGK